MNEAARVATDPTIGAPAIGVPAMSPTALAEVAITDSPMVVAPTAPAPAPRKQTSVLEHAVYVISDNPVTGLLFGLFVIIVLCAIFGSLFTPYDPLASDTAAALQPPSWAHWFGTDQLGRDILSRVIAATRLSPQGNSANMAISTAS